MQKLLVIGAGFGQLPAIVKAKEMGLQVITIDKDPNALGMRTADFAYNIDVLDIPGAIAIAKKHEINGVMTMQTDLPIPTVGAIVDALGLKGSGLEVADKCSNKILTRIAFKKAKVPQPKFIVVASIDQAVNAAEKIGFPCIVKAPDSSGSRGVTKVNSKEFISTAFIEALKYSRQPEIIVEEYIEGIEIGAQTFSVNGECVCVLIHNDTISNPPHMIPIGHSFPVILNENQKRKVVEACKNAVNVLGVQDGPANIDIILDNKNTPKLIEIGARIGATCLPELVSYTTGADYVEQTINACLGNPVKLECIIKKPVAAFIIQAPKDGILKNFLIPQEVQNHPNLIEVEITARVGEKVSILRKGTDRIGKIIVTADSVGQAEELALLLLSRIRINIL